jgi:hypothetical protein
MDVANGPTVGSLHLLKYNVMKWYVSIACCLLALGSLTARAQNVGINIAAPEAALDVYGDLVLRTADIVVANGTTLALDVATNRFSYYRLSGPTAAFTIAGLSFSADGRLVTLFNRSGHALQLNHLDAAAAASERIVTGSGGNITVPDRGVVNLQYDGAEQKWVVLSTNKPGGTTTSGGWGLLGNSGNTSNNFLGNTDGVPLLLKSGGNTLGNFWGSNVSIGNGAGAGFAGGGNNLFLGGKMRSPLTTANYSVAIGTDAEISADNQIIIGAPYHKTGIGLSYIEAPDHTLTVGRRYSNDGALRIIGGQFSSHFNYSGTEDTYIRGGKLLSKVYINDTNGGDVVLGSPTTSSVGIGTNYPLGFAKLEVKTSPESRGLAVGDGTIGIVHFLGGAGRTTNSEGGYIGTNSNHGLHFFTNSAWAQMTLLPNGNVGIGTTNPTYRLSVNGNVRSKEIVVESGWADYVFDEKYPLPALDSVAQYIQRHKHLPGIPAATDIQQQGLPLGELQTKMMAKIEELTLYLIQAHQRIEALEKQLQRSR